MISILGGVSCRFGKVSWFLLCRRWRMRVNRCGVMSESYACRVFLLFISRKRSRRWIAS